MHQPAKHSDVTATAEQPGLLAPDTSGMNFYRADPALTDLLRIHLPDPVADAIRGLSTRIGALEVAADEADGHTPGEVRQLRRAAGGGQPDGRSNPSVGPSPAGG